MEKDELENFKEFGHMVDELTRDPEYLKELIEAYDLHDADRFRELLEARKLWHYCYWVCWWFCYVRCYPVCRLVCH
jgi:hypothetical protein